MVEYDLNDRENGLKVVKLLFIISSKMDKHEDYDEEAAKFKAILGYHPVDDLKPLAWAPTTKPTAKTLKTIAAQFMQLTGMTIDEINKVEV